jgi:hypothetical protein
MILILSFFSTSSVFSRFNFFIIIPHDLAPKFPAWEKAREQLKRGWQENLDKFSLFYDGLCASVYAA